MADAYAFSLGRTGDVAVRLLKRCSLPGGALVLPGEVITVPPALAQQLRAEGFVDPATPPKALEAAPHDKMLHRPVAKKGQA